MSDSDTVTRKGSGRTKGSVSLVSVKFADLAKRFKDEDLVVVGRIFIQKAGVPVHGPAISAPPTPEVAAGVQVVTVPTSVEPVAPSADETVQPATESAPAPVVQTV